MGIYLNPGNDLYTETTGMEMFVDKTMLLSVTNRMLGTVDKYVCMSRPRRFGKTIAQNMIAAYYSRGCDSRDLFAHLKIAGDPG
ncbi:MAG: AAA family ATPase [Lachnospiraceae bacterium]|nr:AAA family ATPase [Lachnospiraceae bacterium]